MAIFDLNDFNYRKVIKLAPDAFVTINGAFGGRVVSPINDEAGQTIDIQGGVVSINVTSAISPPASGRAKIQIVAPEYTGFHTKSTNSSSGYWITLPSGVKIPYFLPMMEVQVFMKGRFLYNNGSGSNTQSSMPLVSSGQNNAPVYYRAFWGFITEITEDYNAGLTTLSLQCSDMLTWWKYQKLTISPNEYTAIFNSGNLAANAFPTIFRNRNPWQIITQLLYETQWLSLDKNATFNFAYPKLSAIATLPYMDGVPSSVIGALAVKMSEYWHERYNFYNEQMKVEMFGLTKAVSDKSLQNLKQSVLEGLDTATKGYNTTLDPDISLDYNLLARVMPFGDFNLFGMGAESLELTKLDIAQKVCDMTQMEFYEDLNGSIVFKPPFYNLDVTKGDVPFYVVDPKDIINYSSSTNTDHIVTFLELTAPQLQQIPGDLPMIGFHIDWELMLRYGMRYQRGHCSYGNDVKSLSLIAAAEMARINAEATTGHISIPLRPEIRLGYPVYITHKDSYFYISGISHNFSFGSSATTDLTLTTKRERMYDFIGTLTNNLPLSAVGSVTPSLGGTQPSKNAVGRVLRGFVQKYRKFTGSSSDIVTSLTQDLVNIANGRIPYADKNAQEQVAYTDPASLKEKTEKEAYLRATQAKTGAQFNGFYELAPAEITSSLSSTTINSDVSNASGVQSTIMSNQLLMITTNTIPYTDIRGYRHIGAFPYGANLVMRNNTLKSVSGSPTEVSDEITATAAADPNGDNSPPQAGLPFVLKFDSGVTANFPITPQDCTERMIANINGGQNQTSTVSVQNSQQ